MQFKKLSANKIQDSGTITNSKEEKTFLLSEQALRKTFKDSSDVVFFNLQFQKYLVTLVYCNGLVSNEMLYKTVPSRLEKFFLDSPNEINEETLHSLKLPTLTHIETIEKSEDEVFSGKVLLVFQGDHQVYSVDISDQPKRNPEEGNMEISIKGPRDNFIEDISVNYALIRKRLRSTSLLSESFEIGKRTRTKVILLYIKDIANLEIIDQLRKKLNEIDIDGLYSGMQLEGLINDNPYSIFPRHTYTGRPDFAVQSLLTGRFVVFIDGVPYAYIAPVNLFFLLKAAEDSETNYFYNAFQRIMRAFGISVAAFLPGFWVALTSFHQNQLPFTLLATVIESRRGVPFPTALEAILMLVLFEVFREAGLRLPVSIGQTLSVIGGLIIGDAAIRAGLTNPAMLVVIAASTIATFTLVNQALVGAVSLLRFVVIIFSATLGFFGFFTSIFLIGTVVAKIQSFDLPYLQVAERLSLRYVLKSIIRIPVKKDDTRPGSINPPDPTKQGGST
ncbi:spore germination protein [Neobacillus kokaensis]|uniref:Spore germination protein n=1 Tax=Neobacillus kokaensis TaxID=2759023 RepID=A0ABQ3NBH4_9BACI|nr:spore germination protein [Neobacillus kokaensis]GHI01251.1 spore germination protein [Neobacillus kokaensis]